MLTLNDYPQYFKWLVYNHVERQPRPHQIRFVNVSRCSLLHVERQTRRHSRDEGRTGTGHTETSFLLKFLRYITLKVGKSRILKCTQLRSVASGSVRALHNRFRNMEY